MPNEIKERADAMLEDMSSSDWEAFVTIGGQPKIAKPGWEITEVVRDVYQAVAISSIYRFCGQGQSPSTALADAYGQMRKFAKELKNHMEET